MVMMAGGRWCSWQVAGDGDHGRWQEMVIMAGGKRW